MKTCSKCGLHLELLAFYTNPSRKDGLASECKTCSNARYVKWRRKNKKKANEARARYLKRYPEKRKNKRNGWKRRNPDTFKFLHNKYEKARSMKQRSQLAEAYIKQRLHLFDQTAPPELIEAKRAQLQLHRITNPKKQKHESAN